MRLILLQDLQYTNEQLTKIQEEQGDLKLFITLILIISGILIYVFTISRLKAVAELSVNKALEGYKSDLQQKLIEQERFLEAKIALAFKNEGVRTNILAELGKKASLIKIELWQELFQFYFDYQKSWSFKLDTPIEEWEPIYKKYEELRHKCFFNKIYLGSELSQRFIRFVVNIKSAMDNAQSRMKAEAAIGKGMNMHGNYEVVLSIGTELTNAIANSLDEIPTIISTQIGGEFNLKQLEVATQTELENIEKDLFKRESKVANVINKEIENQSKK